MPNTPSELLKESEKDFDKKFTYASFTWNGDNATGVKFAKSTRKKAKSHLTSLTIKLLENEISRLKTMRVGGTINFWKGYDQSIEDQVDTLESQLSEIKKI